MVQPIGSGPRFPDQEGQITAAAKDLRATIQLFRTSLTTFMQTPARINEANSLHEFSQALQKLDVHSKRAIDLG